MKCRRHPYDCWTPRGKENAATLTPVRASVCLQPGQRSGGVVTPLPVGTYLVSATPQTGSRRHAQKEGSLCTATSATRLSRWAPANRPGTSTLLVETACRSYASASRISEASSRKACRTLLEAGADGPSVIIVRSSRVTSIIPRAARPGPVIGMAGRRCLRPVGWIPGSVPADSLRDVCRGSHPASDCFPGAHSARPIETVRSR